MKQYVEEGEEDMADVNATDSWAEEQGVLAGTSSLFPYSVWAYDQACSEDGHPDNLHHLSKNDDTSEGVASNARPGSLPDGLSTSQHHDQYSHQQDLGKDKEEEFQWMEEGEENICGVNAREEEVNCQKEGDWAGGGEIGECLPNGKLPPDTHPSMEELEGLSATSSQNLIPESFRWEGEKIAGGVRGGRRGESGEIRIWILTGGRTLKEAWRSIKCKKRRKNVRRKKSEMIEKRRRKGNNNIKNTTAKMSGKIRKRKKRRQSQIKILKRRKGKSKMEISRNSSRKRRKKKTMKKGAMRNKKKRMRRRRRNENTMRGRRRKRRMTRRRGRRMRRRKRRKRRRTRWSRRKKKRKERETRRRRRSNVAAANCSAVY